jgi:hypothetical protein
VIRTPAPGEDFVNHLHLHGKIAAVAFVRSGSSTAFVVQVSFEFKSAFDFLLTKL